MLLETVTTSFTKALKSGNSGQGTFQTLTVLTVTPDQIYSDGVIDFANVGVLGTPGAEFTQNRIQLIPYADGATGSTFNFRIYGWDYVDKPDPRLGVWVPFLLAEFQATTSAVAGVAGYTISATEHLADFVKLINGSTGTTGFAGGYNGSAAATGTNLVPLVLVTVAGCRYIQFDFQKSSNVTMNCLWARA